MAQEVRIALLLKGATAPWRVAQLAAIDWWRHEWGRAPARGRRQRELLSGFKDGADPLALLESRDPSPELALLWYRVQRALPKLPPRYRMMLLLRHVQGLDMREIGRRIGVSECRVSQLMPYAHNALRMAIKP